jgi:hypothetical protein
LSAFSTVAGAAPISGPASASAATVDAGSDLLLVREGCGRGYHRNRFGVCRRNMGPHEGGCWWVHRRHSLVPWHLVCR